MASRAMYRDRLLFSLALTCVSVLSQTCISPTAQIPNSTDTDEVTKSVALSFSSGTSGVACWVLETTAVLYCTPISLQYSHGQVSNVTARPSSYLARHVDHGDASHLPGTTQSVICVSESGAGGYCKLLSQSNGSLSVLHNSNVSWSEGPSDAMSLGAASGSSALLCRTKDELLLCQWMREQQAWLNTSGGAWQQSSSSSRVPRSSQIAVAGLHQAALVCYVQWDQSGAPQYDKHGVRKPFETDAYTGLCDLVAPGGPSARHTWVSTKQRPYNLVLARLSNSTAVLCWRESNSGRCRVWSAVAGFSQPAQTFSKDVREDTIAVTAASESSALVCYQDKNHNTGVCKLYRIQPGPHLKQYKNKLEHPFGQPGCGIRLGLSRLPGSTEASSSVALCYGTFRNGPQELNQQFCTAVAAVEACVEGNHQSVWRVVVGVAVGGAALLCCAAGGIYLCRKRKVCCFWSKEDGIDRAHLLPPVTHVVVARGPQDQPPSEQE